MQTLSTGEVSKMLGYLVTRQFIEKMGFKPAEVVKGHPRWAASDFYLLCHKIGEHTMAAATKFDVALQHGKKAPITAVDDDDEL